MKGSAMGAFAYGRPARRSCERREGDDRRGEGH